MLGARTIEVDQKLEFLFAKQDERTGGGGRVWCVCRKTKLSRRLALKIIVLLTHSYECELSGMSPFHMH